MRDEGTVGAQVRAQRIGRGWSMRELAERLGVSAPTISAIENGQTGVSVQRLGEFAAVFGVSVTTLLRPPRPAGPPVRHRPAWRTFEPLQLDPALAAALESFVATGYHGAGMRTIAERADMSQAGLYHYYPSKQSLLVALLDLTMDELDWRVEAAVQSAEVEAGPLVRLHLLVEALALYHTLRADLAFIGASEMRSLHNPDRERIAARRSGIQHRIDAEIAGAVRAGEAVCPNPIEVGRAIATMCTSLPQWFDVNGNTSAEGVAGQYADLALLMVGAVVTDAAAPGSDRTSV